MGQGRRNRAFGTYYPSFQSKIEILVWFPIVFQVLSASAILLKAVGTFYIFSFIDLVSVLLFMFSKNKQQSFVLKVDI